MKRITLPTLKNVSLSIHNNIYRGPSFPAIGSVINEYELEVESNNFIPISSANIVMARNDIQFCLRGVFTVNLINLIEPTYTMFVTNLNLIQADREKITTKAYLSMVME